MSNFYDGNTLFHLKYFNNEMTDLEIFELGGNVRANVG